MASQQMEELQSTKHSTEDLGGKNLKKNYAVMASSQNENRSEALPRTSDPSFAI